MCKARTSIAGCASCLLITPSGYPRFFVRCLCDVCRLSNPRLISGVCPRSPSPGPPSLTKLCLLRRQVPADSVFLSLIGYLTPSPCIAFHVNTRPDFEGRRRGEVRTIILEREAAPSPNVGTPMSGGRRTLMAVITGQFRTDKPCFVIITRCFFSCFVLDQCAL